MGLGLFWVEERGFDARKKRYLRCPGGRARKGLSPVEKNDEYYEDE
jgi:hypothetical protein